MTNQLIVAGLLFGAILLTALLCHALKNGAPR